MFKMKTVKEQLHEVCRENIRLRTVLDKTGADVEYIAMMTDVELDTGSDETEENENDEQ